MHQKRLYSQQNITLADHAEGEYDCFQNKKSYRYFILRK